MIVEGNIERMITPNLTEKSIVDMTKLKAGRVRGGVKAKGSVEVLVDLNDDVELELFVYQLQGNEYRLTPYKIPKTKFCEYYARERAFNSATFEAFGVPDKCPIPKKVYSGETSFDFSKIPPNFDGRFKIVINYYRFGENVGVFQLLIEIHHYYA
jgi:hypothetical protein